VEAFELDALRFERVLDATPRARDLASHSTAARLAEALSWWRGPALADFVGALWADTEAARLEELRLDALERWAAARLALGEHAALVPALESLIAEHPLRERLWAQLMLALYRSDRQADALRAYGRLRQHLGDELGIEPSTDLAALETAILRHEPELEWVPDRGRPAVVSPLPSGAVTFLFTDIVGSTKLWEEQPDEMRAAVADQDQIVRAAVAAHDGVVVKSTGDGLIAVFHDAPSAASAAVDAQLAVTRGAGGVPVALRMGLHTGSARPDNGDYQGPAVNRAARVAAQAYAGQILVSGATAALLEEWSLRDVGEHRLAGLPPMRLFQVVTPELPIDFPPLTTAVPRVDLPSSPTTFVGRGDEVDTIRRLVEQHRLVTMTGVGGCGKTRLAIETAASLEATFPDGVHLADLAAVTDSDRVNDAVIAALGLASDGTGRDPAERIAAYLADRAVLCVLDNCEHVVDACAELANAVINRSGSSRLLATSREPLGVVGEQVYVVPPLDVDTEAVQLFADRAAEARAGFTVGETNRSTVAEICRRLDGLPLAIELAAATIAHLSPVQVLERLDDRFRLLTGGRGRRQRHQTLAATLDWSHDLLSPTERLVLRRLAAFPATFSSKLHSMWSTSATSPTPWARSLPSRSCRSSTRVNAFATGSWRACASTPRRSSPPRTNAQRLAVGIATGCSTGSSRSHSKNAGSATTTAPLPSSPTSWPRSTGQVRARMHQPSPASRRGSTGPAARRGGKHDDIARRCWLATTCLPSCDSRPA
jgi:class 3 adenylate cyclase